MKPPIQIKPHLLLALCLVIAGSSVAFADEKLDLSNPGFEDGLSSWDSSHDNDMSRAVADAAHNGRFGLRVQDRSDTLGSSLISAPLPVISGKRYSVRFWGRILEGEGLAVYLIFFDAQGGYLNKQELGNENLTMIPKTATDWTQFSVDGAAPDNAFSLKVWIHSFTKSIVVADVDDFTVLELK